ncbi:MAG: GtrA family protein [Ruminococcus callidus]
MAGTAADSERKAIWETVCRSNRKYTDSIFRYCFVGGAATVIDWCFCTTVFPGVSSELCSSRKWDFFVAGLLANYFLSTFWVFRSSKVQSRLVEFLAFAAIGVVGLLLTIGITKVSEITLGNITSAYQMIGKVVSTMVAFLWNFFARKYLLFSKKEA